MSLDVYLFCPECGHTVGEHNVTHNLRNMADEAGIYKLLWEPDKIGVTHARQMIEPLRAAIADMKARPEHYRPLEASNGWGTYDRFVPWLEDLALCCENAPTAEVQVCR